MITSVQNNLVKDWRKLHQRKFREQTNTFLIEGFHTVQEAVNSNWHIETIIVKQDIKIPNWINKNDVVIVSNHILEHITQTKTPQGIVAVVKMNQTSTVTGNNLLLIDGIQDPGNLGTIIRTADAAGYDGIILGHGTVDLYNDKVIRATQGSLFHLPVIQANLPEEITKLREEGFIILASTLQGAVNYTEIEKPNKYALILGNEGSGISERISQLADHHIKIPIYGQAESLNVSVAAGILMYTLKI